MDPTLVLPDGRRIDLDGDVVLGRAPVAPESAQSARAISLSAPTISKTHVLIGHDADGVWLVDLDSSNGTEVLDATGMSERAVAGRRMAVQHGSHIRVGTDTIITIDAGSGPSDDGVDDDDLDRTVAVRPPRPLLVPIAPIVADRPGPGEAVDWSSVTDPGPSAPIVAEPVAPTPPHVQPPPPVQPPAQPESAQPPPIQPVPTSLAGYLHPHPAPPLGAPPPAAPPVTTYIGQDGPPPFAVAPSSSAFPSTYPSYAAAPSAAGADSSPAHLIGAVVLLGWSAVVFLAVREWLPDFFLRAIDGRVAGFFVAPGRDELRIQEYFSLVSLPDGVEFLSWAAEIGPLVAILAAVVALVVRRAPIRWIVVGLVAVPMILNVGLLVSLGFIDFSILTGNIDRFVPWFVLPIVGSALLLWPERRTPSGPTPLQGVFYDSGQPPASAPYGPGASPFS